MASGTITRNYETIDLSSYVANGWTLKSDGLIKAYIRNGVINIIAKGLLSPSTLNAYVTSNLPNKLRISATTPLGLASNVTDKNSDYTVVHANALAIANIGFTGWYKVDCEYQFNITYPMGM